MMCSPILDNRRNRRRADHCLGALNIWPRRVVHGSDGPAGRVGSRFCQILAGRVGSGQHFRFFSLLLIISRCLNLRILHSD